MNSRRVICFLLGAWLAGSLVMSWVATQNFRSVDRLLTAPSPAAEKDIRVLNRDEARKFLRYHSAELNRYYFSEWEKVQLGMGVLLFLLLLFATTVGWFPLAAAVLATAIVALQHWELSVRMVWYGRAIDFLSPDLVTPERNRFASLHSLYTSAEIFKLVLLLVLAARFLFSRRGSRRRRRQVGEEVHAIDDADNGHVDG